MKTWAIDPVGLTNIQLEVSENLQQTITGLWEPSVHGDVAFGQMVKL